MLSTRLLTTKNPKLEKSVKFGFMTAGLSLAPNIISGNQVCPKASPGCANACLFTAGRGAMSRTMESRINKTRMFFDHRDQFIKLLIAEIIFANSRAQAYGYKLAVRLNIYSDLPWEKFIDMESPDLRDVHFYDYTKILNRKTPSNYHLTFSRSEINQRDCYRAIDQGMNVAVVFDKIPSHYLGLPVIDGTTHDLRFLDPQGVVVGLRALGRGRHDQSGFVVRGMQS